MSDEPVPTPTPPPDGELPSVRPLYRDPLYVGGVLVALLAAGLYFAYFSATPPAAPERPAVARFARVAGPVSMREPDVETWTEAATGQRLRNRDRVRTEAAGGAELEFDNGNRVQVRPSSEVIVTDPTTVLPGGGSAWTVQAGEATFDLKERARITTPGATTTADALTTGNIEVDQEGTTGISVFTGQAEVATLGGGTISLTANQGVRVDATGQAGPRLELPSPPIQTAPPREAVISWLQGQGGSTTLSWNPVEHGTSYRVAIDLNVEQAELLLSAALNREGIEAPDLPMSALERGDYYWRVAGVNAEGMAGAFSKVWFFSVVDPPPAPPAAPLTVSDVAGLGEILYVSGRVSPGSQVSVDGQALRVAPDGRFSEYLRRPAEGSVLIQATQPDGAVTEERRTIVDAPPEGD